MNSETHDYSKTWWGWDYTFTPKENGQRGHMMGWSTEALTQRVVEIKPGDYLILKNGWGTTRYRVDDIKYFDDPRDMWSAEVTYAPRKTVTP